MLPEGIDKLAKVFVLISLEGLQSLGNSNTSVGKKSVKMSLCDVINITEVEVLILLKKILNGELKEGLGIVAFMGCGEGWRHLFEKLLDSVAKPEDADLNLVLIIVLYFQL